MAEKAPTEIKELTLNDEYKTKEINIDKEKEPFVFKLEYLEKIDMDIFCTIIPNINNELFKTIKVFSPDAYPHMNTKDLNPEKYKISDIFNVKKFPNKHHALPFP